MRLDPHHPPGHLITLGQAQFEREQLKEAPATIERAVKRIVDHEFLWIYLASSYGHLGRIKDADDAIESANDLRATRGESFLHLESRTEWHFTSEIDFSRSGEKQAQERLRAGLTEIPALTWQHLVTHFTDVGIQWFEVKGATAIDVHTAKSLHDRGVTFVDASPEKFRNKQGWIPRSVSLPEPRSNNPNNRRLTEKTLMNILDKTDEVVFYGFVGAGAGDDSAFASAKALNWGYQNVFYFEGW